MSKRSSKHRALLFGSLGLLGVFAVVLTLGWREKERRARIAFFSQPFSARLSLERGKVPDASLSGMFGVKMRCFTKGGTGKAQWLVRGQLLDNSDKTPRELWNTQELLAPERITPVGIYSGPDYLKGFGSVPLSFPESSYTMNWRFAHQNSPANHLTFVVEAVVIPLPVSQELLGNRDLFYVGSVDVSYATPAQIAEAQQQPGACYIQQTLALDSQDDNQYSF